MKEKILENLTKKKGSQIVFIQIFLVFISFWFLLKGLKTDGVWETIILSWLFFWLFPFLVYKQRKEEFSQAEVSNSQKLKIFLQILVTFIVFSGLLFWLKDWSFLKMNPLSRVEWFLNDWWVLVFLDLVLLPVVIFSQEFFFRKFLISEFEKSFTQRAVLVFQAVVFVAFEVLFFGAFSWKFILLSFILALFWGGLYAKTRSIWYSFFARWGLILILEGFILSIIKDAKI